MEAHAVPQNVTAFEFHLIGNMTMRQFGYLAAGMVVSYFTFLLFGTTIPFVAWPIIIVSASTGAAYAFLPIMDRPLDYWTKAFFRAVTKPTLRKYKSLRFPKDDENFQNRLNIYFHYLQEQAYVPQQNLPLPIPNVRQDYSEPIALPHQDPQPQIPVEPKPQPVPQIQPRPQMPVERETKAPAPTVQLQNAAPVAHVQPAPQPMIQHQPVHTAPIQAAPQPAAPQIPHPVTPPPPPTPKPEPVVPPVQTKPAPKPEIQKDDIAKEPTQPLPASHDQISQFLDKLGKLKTQQVQTPVPVAVPTPVAPPPPAEVKPPTTMHAEAPAPTEQPAHEKPSRIEVDEISKIVQDIMKKQNIQNPDDIRKITEDVIAEKVKQLSPVIALPKDAKITLNNATILAPNASRTQETQKILDLLENQQTTQKTTPVIQKNAPKSGPIIIMPVDMPTQPAAPSNDELSKTVNLAKEAQNIQEEIHQTEKQINWIRTNNRGSDEFQSSLAKLQQLHSQEEGVTKKLALIAKTPTHEPAKPTTKPSIIPTLTLTQTPNIINGIVIDAQGSYIDSAIIVAHDGQGMPVRALKTNKLGQFIAATPLRDGKYMITVEKEDLQFDPVEVELNGVILNPVVVSAKKGGAN